MRLLALGWKVQAWVPCAPTLTSSHRCHASSLGREQGASQRQRGGPAALARCRPCAAAAPFPQPVLPGSSGPCQAKLVLPWLEGQQHGQGRQWGGAGSVVVELGRAQSQVARCRTWDAEQGQWSLGCATLRPGVLAMPLTLCQPHSEAAGRRAGGSRGALRGPSSTRSACAAGHGCCSTARCLLGR